MREREAVCAHASISKSVKVAIMHMNGATATIMLAMGRSERRRGTDPGNTRV